MSGLATSPGPDFECTVIDDFLDVAGFQGLLAGLQAVTSGITSRPFTLDRHKRSVEASLLRVVSESLVGLDWTSTLVNALDLGLELRQIDPAVGSAWAPKASENVIPARFLLAMYHGPLSVGDATFLLGPSMVEPPVRRVRARANRAVFPTSGAAVWIPPFGPPLAECGQDLFILSGDAP